MISIDQAKANVRKLPIVESVEAAIRYKGFYICRVKFAAAGEEDYDPFFSVDVNSGEVKDFSVVGSGDISLIGFLFMEAADGEDDE